MAYSAGIRICVIDTSFKIKFMTRASVRIACDQHVPRATEYSMAQFERALGAPIRGMRIGILEECLETQ